MKRRIVVALLVASVAVPGFGRELPKASTSEYLETTAAGLNIAGGPKPLFYSLILSVRKKLDAPVYVRTLFERPGHPEKPLVEETRIEPGKDSILLESPLFQGIENNTTYSVTVILFADEGYEKEIGRHDQDVHFSVPSKRHFKRLGLKKP